MLSRRVILKFLGKTSSRRNASNIWPSRITNPEYSERRQRLLEKLISTLKPGEKNVLVVLKGAERFFIAPDVPNSFRQCSHFRYLTGVTSPGCYYIMSAQVDDDQPKEQQRILVADRRTAVEELWEGQLPSESDWASTAQFSDLQPSKQLPAVLEKLCDQQTAVFVSESASSAISAIVGKKCFSLRSLAPFVDQLRLTKSSSEMDSMRDVCTLGAQTMCATIASSRNTHMENAIVGLLEYEGRRRGSEKQAYPPVVASGSRANTIHYLEANNDIHPNDCVLVDAGCDLNGYVSDITRCFPISGNWNDHQRSLYEALLFCHEQLIEYAASMEKVRLSYLYRRMMELLAASMGELGLIRQGDNASMLKAAEMLCPHHVSHYLGMDVHDTPSVSRDIELPSNVCFTIEPGVYVPLDWPRKEWRGIGFRIEDDVATLAGGGCELLTSSVPRSTQHIQQLMNQWH